MPGVAQCQRLIGEVARADVAEVTLAGYDGAERTGARAGGYPEVECRSDRVVAGDAYGRRLGTAWSGGGELDCEVDLVSGADRDGRRRRRQDADVACDGECLDLVDNEVETADIEDLKGEVRRTADGAEVATVLQVSGDGREGGRDRHRNRIRWDAVGHDDKLVAAGWHSRRD